ncbi:hypothetical protein IW967_01705 [Alicyclobacillus mali]|uniref:Uncharacterized protein n=1 Tax=Alicyclobacillus mali (ex Roth et al. 2021) TaxID=1123961 RepID=A0ABS0EZY4_9BACL|nr:hypothetical protein [Alicyclobacillus mali (ex Roth et al. 2021)]MBF8376592.1 hypothetical protein [Alicyclobacillus mali (ex Roth et al. 2021)]MCL6489769.1 hypothetical protein [Alicyclobacillus mali (ex Roth et al. 2021)]
MNHLHGFSRIMVVMAATAGSGSMLWASTALADTVQSHHSAPLQATASAQLTHNHPNFVFLPPWPDEE